MGITQAPGEAEVELAYYHSCGFVDAVVTPVKTGSSLI